MVKYPLRLCNEFGCAIYKYLWLCDFGCAYDFGYAVYNSDCVAQVIIIE